VSASIYPTRAGSLRAGALLPGFPERNPNLIGFSEKGEHSPTISTINRKHRR